LILSLLGAVLKSNVAHPIGFQPPSRASVPQYSSLKSFGPFVVSFNFIGSDALQELVITPALSPPSQIPKPPPSLATQQSNQMHRARRPGTKLFAGRLAYKLLINPTWSMYFSIHTLCSLRRIGGMLNLFYFETIVHAGGKILDMIVIKCIGECLKNVVAYIFKIFFSEKPRGIDFAIS
jgi:hypothetical protein